MELSGVSVFLLLGDEAKPRLRELLLANGARRAAFPKVPNDLPHDINNLAVAPGHHQPSSN
jgi:hypothetical protein